VTSTPRRRRQPLDQHPVGGLVQRGQRAAPGRPTRGVGRVRRGGRERVEGRHAPPQVLGPRGGHPVVVQADAGGRVERGEITARDHRADLVEVAHRARQRHRRPGGVDGVDAERPAEAPDGGAQVGARGREVGPDAGGQRVALVRAGVQGEEREQPPVRTRKGHRFAVALGADVTEQPHPQHRATIWRPQRHAYPR
jgi:hypothetical protein